MWDFMTISAIRTVIIYVFIVAAMRIMGKRQLGEMQPSELVVTLMISDLATVPMQENGMPLSGGLIPIMLLIAMEIILSGVMLKSPFFRKLVSGKPRVVIDNGRVDAKALRDLRLSVDDLMEALRQQGYFDLREIQYAIVESGGKVSVFLNAGSRPATCDVLGAAVEENGMPMVIISDGVISEWGMRICGISQKWVDGILKKNKCGAEDVFIMTADRSRAYTLMRKDSG